MNSELTWMATAGDCGLMTDKPARGKGPSKTERKLSEDLSSRCRIYFPTRETILQSKGGIGVRSPQIPQVFVDISTSTDWL